MDPRPKKNILRDDDDNPVYDKVDHRVIEMPPGEDPHFFVDQGLLNRMYMGGIPTPDELLRMAQLIIEVDPIAGTTRSGFLIGVAAVPTS
ncbi:MAG: hypothetical protein ACLQME_09155 [Alphaproteobacteria bacterium]